MILEEVKGEMICDREKEGKYYWGNEWPFGLTLLKRAATKS